MWVDRVLNVIGSGFMHNRYFADMMNVYVSHIFDAEPLESQPAVVADMGACMCHMCMHALVHVRAMAMPRVHRAPCTYIMRRHAPCTTMHHTHA